MTRISEYEGNIMRETVSQLQEFPGLNKGPGIFLSRRQNAVLLHSVFGSWALAYVDVKLSNSRHKLPDRTS
jgi:hypothetical protein